MEQIKIARGIRAADKDDFVDAQEVLTVFSQHQAPYRWTRPAFEDLLKGVKHLEQLHKLINRSSDGPIGYLTKSMNGVQAWCGSGMRVSFREDGNHLNILAFIHPDSAKDEAPKDEVPEELSRYQALSKDAGLGEQRTILRYLLKDTWARRVCLWHNQHAKPLWETRRCSYDCFRPSRQQMEELSERSSTLVAPRAIPMDAVEPYEVEIQRIKLTSSPVLLYLDTDFGFREDAAEFALRVLNLLSGDLEFEVDSTLPVCCFCDKPVLAIRGLGDSLPPEWVRPEDGDLHFFKAFGSCHTHCLKKSHLRHIWGRKKLSNLPSGLELVEDYSKAKLYRAPRLQKTYVMGADGTSLILTDSELDKAEKLDTGEITIPLGQDLELDLTAWPDLASQVRSILAKGEAYPLRSLVLGLGIKNEMPKVGDFFLHSIQSQPDEPSDSVFTCRVTSETELEPKLFRQARSAAYPEKADTGGLRETLGVKFTTTSTLEFLKRMRPLFDKLEPCRPIPGLPDEDVILELCELGYAHLLVTSPSVRRVEAYPNTYQIGKTNDYEVMLHTDSHSIATYSPTNATPIDLGLRSDEYLEVCWINAAWRCQARLSEEYSVMGLRRLSHHFYSSIPALSHQELKKLFPSLLRSVEEYKIDA